ncbi:MAG: leucyl/phenylalanyl-tRNA--protein transferase [Gammaproteobacteria bacterium]
MTAPYWLNPYDPTDFPNVSLALRDPDGLLAVGGDLSIERLLTAYQRGIFPWYSGDQPILWWSPDPRSVLFPHKLHISRSLRKTLRKQLFTITFDTAFADVIRACSEPRADGLGTWITDEMQQAYLRLHQAGYAHSVECWLKGELVGGLYGVAIGTVFFGESMFSRVADASKVAFVFLVRQLQRWQFELIDCQIQTAYMNQFGAELIPRSEFIKWLGRSCKQPRRNDVWTIDTNLASSIP